MSGARVNGRDRPDRVNWQSRSTASITLMLHLQSQINTLERIMRHFSIGCLAFFLCTAGSTRAQEKSTASQGSQPFLKQCTARNPQPCADKPPRIIYAPAPECSKEAHKKRIDGTVVLEIVVGTDGLVNGISVVQPLGFGLEEAATKAVKTWRFKPGKSLGNPAPVQMRVEAEFRCQLL
jgi:TonB family protein